MGFIIELAHRNGTAKYIGAVPTASPHDFVNTVFDTFDEARRFPFPTAEVAASVVTTLPVTKNIDYRVVEAPVIDRGATPALEGAACEDLVVGKARAALRGEYDARTIIRRELPADDDVDVAVKPHRKGKTRAARAGSK